MALPSLSGEFGVIKDPELTFTPKGTARLKLRIKANDRKKNSNGDWVDGEAWYGDLIVWDRLAQNLTESINKGDTIVVLNARCEPYSYEARDGSGTKQGVQYVADTVGVSVRWRPVGGSANVDSIKEALGAEEIAPF